MEENQDTKIVLNFFPGEPAENNSKESNNDDSKDSAHDENTTEIPNHNGIISIDNITPHVLNGRNQSIQ